MTRLRPFSTIVLLLSACAGEPVPVTETAGTEPPQEPQHAGGEESQDGPPFGLTFLRTDTPGLIEIAGNVEGGEEFADDCSPNVMVGVDVQVSGFLQRAAIVCAEVQMAGGVVTTGSVERRPERGRREGTAASARCPDGHVVVGFEGRAGLAIDQLVLHCAPLTAVGSLAELGAPVATPPVGGEGGEAFAPALCPEGEVGAGATLRAGDSLDAFGLRCAPMMVRVVLPEDAQEYAGERSARIADAVAHYDTLRAVRYEQVQDPTMDQALERLRERVDAIADHIVALDASCRAIVERDRADLADCTELQADARAVFARLILQYRMEPPADFMAEVASHPRQEREAAVANFEREMRAMTWTQASRVFCDSIAIYEAADTPRARAQLTRYGEAFVTQCRAQDAAEALEPVRTH